jgi:hypothetical protein
VEEALTPFGIAGHSSRLVSRCERAFVKCVNIGNVEDYPTPPGPASFSKAQAFSRCSNQRKTAFLQRPTCPIQRRSNPCGCLARTAPQHSYRTPRFGKGWARTNRGGACKVSSRDLGGQQSDLLRESAGRCVIGRARLRFGRARAKTEEPMKKEIWQENKERYFEWNPIEGLAAKFTWAAIGAAAAVVAMYLLR